MMLRTPKFIAFGGSGLLWILGFALVAGDAVLFIGPGALIFVLLASLAVAASSRPGVALIGCWAGAVVALTLVGAIVDRGISGALYVGTIFGTLLFVGWAVLGFVLLHLLGHGPSRRELSQLHDG